MTDQEIKDLAQKIVEALADDCHLPLCMVNETEEVKIIPKFLKLLLRDHCIVSQSEVIAKYNDDKAAYNMNKGDCDYFEGYWEGRVWLNPPYNRKDIVPFIRKMAEHGNGIALLFNRMDIALWHEVIFPSADAILVMRGRVKFLRSDGSQGDAAGCGSVLVAWGKYNASCLGNCGIAGRFISLR